VVSISYGDAFAGNLTTTFLCAGRGFTLTEVGAINKGFGIADTTSGGSEGGELIGDRDEPHTRTDLFGRARRVTIRLHCCSRERQAANADDHRDSWRTYAAAMGTARLSRASSWRCATGASPPRMYALCCALGGGTRLCRGRSTVTGSPLSAGRSSSSSASSLALARLALSSGLRAKIGRARRRTPTLFFRQLRDAFLQQHDAARTVGRQRLI